MIKLHTSFGVIGIEVDAEKAPLSAKNFLDYVAAGHYDNTIFPSCDSRLHGSGRRFRSGHEAEAVQGADRE
jgi:peptidyl-prolyl cis-trans isomerase B (cyclophilin B)